MTHHEAGVGELTLPAPIPDDATLLGISVYVQMLCADPGGAGGLTHTEGMRITICDG